MHLRDGGRRHRRCGSHPRRQQAGVAVGRTTMAHRTGRGIKMLSDVIVYRNTRNRQMKNDLQTLDKLLGHDLELGGRGWELCVLGRGPVLVGRVALLGPPVIVELGRE